jgi:hypothetical protein
MPRKTGDYGKNTKEIRERFKQLIESNLSTLEADLKSLRSVDRVKAIIDLSKFVIPTLKATTLEAGVNLQAEKDWSIKDVLGFTSANPQEQIKEPTEAPKAKVLSAIELEMEAQEKRLEELRIEEERKSPQPRNNSNEPPLYNIL